MIELRDPDGGYAYERLLAKYEVQHSDVPSQTMGRDFPTGNWATNFAISDWAVFWCCPGVCVCVGGM